MVYSSLDLFLNRIIMYADSVIIEIHQVRQFMLNVRLCVCDKGVDADVADKVTEENLDNAVAFAKAFAARTGAVVAITGAIDIVADAQKAYCIRNGNAMMSSITGTGCQLSALTAAFVTANPDQPLEATAAAVCAMGLAGEIAHQRLTPQDGNATYRNYIIDAIYNMTPEQLEKGANYEVR